MSGVTGSDRLRRDAQLLRTRLGAEVGRELRGSVDRPLGQFRRAVDTAIAGSFPNRYAGVFGGSFRIKVAVTSGSAALRVKLTGTARGKRSIRDSAALNRGVLRHKTWGRLPWHSQAVRPGFWDEPAKALAGDIRDGVEQTIQQVAKTIEAQL